MKISVLILVGLLLLRRIIIVLGYPEISRNIIPDRNDEDIWSEFQRELQHSVGTQLNSSNHDSDVISPFFSPLEGKKNTALGRSKRSTSGSMSRAKQLERPGSRSASTSSALSLTSTGARARNPMGTSQPGTGMARSQSRQHSSALRPRNSASSSSRSRMQHGEASLAGAMGGNRNKVTMGGGKSRIGSKTSLSPTGTAARGARRGAKTGIHQRRPSAVGRRAGAGLSKTSGRRANTGRLPAQRKPGLLRGLKERLQRRRPKKPTKSSTANRRQSKNPAASRKNRKMQKKVPVGRKSNRVKTPLSRQRTSPSPPARPPKLANLMSRTGQRLMRAVRSLRNRGSTALQRMRNGITNIKKLVSKKNLKKQAARTKSAFRGVQKGLRTRAGRVKSARKRLVSAGKSRHGIKSKPGTGQAKSPGSEAKKKPSSFARTKAGIKSWAKKLKNRFKRTPKKSPSPGSSSKDTKTGVAGKGSKGQQKGSSGAGGENNPTKGHVPKSVSAKAADKNKGEAQQGKNNIKQPLMCKI